MQIFIKALNVTAVPNEINKKETVYDLRETILIKEGIPIKGTSIAFCENII